MAAVILPNMRPIMSNAMVSFILRATIKTMSSTIKLPRLEAIAKATSLARLKLVKPTNKEAPIISSAAPKLAPELIPSTKGPANGFLKSVCIKSPLRERPPPIKIAAHALGIR